MHPTLFHKEAEMPTVKITTKHQVVIPHEVFKKLNLAVGDFLEAFEKAGKIIMVPKRLADRVPAVALSAQEQRVLARAQDKIELINSDPLKSKGLTKSEIRVAVKAGLIEAEQAWWWTEKSQKGYREGLVETEEGGLTDGFESVEELKAHLTE